MAFTGATAGLAAGAQTNDTRMDFALEATYATPPSGNYQALRITGESFSRGQTTARPEEINALKEVSQSVVTQVSASGTISGALSSGTFDDLIAGVMGSDWNIQTYSGSDGFELIIEQKNSLYSGVDDIYLKNSSGSIVGINDVHGFVAININDNNDNITSSNLFTYSNINPGVYIVPAGTLKSGGTFKDFTVTIASLVNSNIDKTFTIRKKLLGNFLLYPGSLITQVQIQLQQAQFGTVSVDVTSATELKSDTDIAAAVLPAPSGAVHNSVNNFLGATIFGKVPQGCVTQFTCTLGRDGSGNDYSMGHDDACGVRAGQFTASGSIEFYFRSWDEYEASIQGTQGPIVVQTVDDSGNGYAFIFLNAALRNAKVNASQTNQTVRASFDIEGNPASGGGTFAIFRLGDFAATGA